MEPLLPKLVSDACRTMQSLLGQEQAFEQIARAAVDALKSGGKILTCGNGGSAADALHLAEELVGRYNRNRPSLPAICLCADATLLTCIANDYGFDVVFSRQVEGLGKKDDLLVCFTSSGNSANILLAIEAARTKGVKTVALLGKGGGKTKGKANLELIVDGTDTARIQEAHTLLLHALLERIEVGVFGEPKPVSNPASQPAAKPVSKPVSSTKPAMKSSPAAGPVTMFRNVLIVEDDFELSNMLVEVLTFENCTTDTATNGMEGLEQMQSNNYDAIICDLMMPRVDGEAFYREVEKRYPYMTNRFLFITGQASLKAGMTDFIYPTGNALLQKPFEVEDLRTAIHELFQRVS